MERIEIRVDPANEASLAIPRKLGFVEEGTMRGVFHGADGKPRRATRSSSRCCAGSSSATSS